MQETLNRTLISVLELRRLLFDLLEKRPDICVSFRLLGELWNVNFLRVMRMTEKGGIFFDEAHGLVSVSDLNFVMQFEIDKPFQVFQPYYHYEVTPAVEV